MALSKAKVKMIESAIERLFESIKARVLGPSYVKGKQPKRVYIGWKPSETIPGLYVMAATEEGVKPSPGALNSLTKIAVGYLDAQKGITKAKVVQAVDTFMRDASAKGVVTDVKTVLGGELADVFASAHKMVTRIVDTEATHARNLGTVDAIVQVNSAAGENDASVYFVVVRDQHTCGECKRLHLMPDGVTPRVYKMSEIGAGYHKRGQPNPKVGGLHPHCRCTMAPIMRGYGFNASGRAKWISPGHDEYAIQRSMEKSEAGLSKTDSSVAPHDVTNHLRTIAALPSPEAVGVHLQALPREHVAAIMDHVGKENHRISAAKTGDPSAALLYHGSPHHKDIKTNGFKLTQGGRSGFMGADYKVQNQGVFLSNNKHLARYFGENRANHASDAGVLPVYANLGNTLDMQKMPRALYRHGKDLLTKWAGPKDNKLVANAYFWLLDQPKFAEAIKASGYHSVKFPEDRQIHKEAGTTPKDAHTVMVFDPSRLQVHHDHISTFEDLWNHARSLHGVQKSEDLEKMAIKDLKPGTTSNEQTDYSHLLTPEHRKAGYGLHVLSGGTGHFIEAGVSHHGERIGYVAGGMSGVVDGKPTVQIESSSINDAHQGKGLGTAAYEAFMAHSYHKHGARQIESENHTSAAHAVHQKLAAKHGLAYKPASGNAYASDEFGDGKYNGYRYAMKSEADLSKTDYGSGDKWYHITDNPQFALNPKYAPEDNSVGIHSRAGKNGIYLTQSPERWVNGHNYVRPYVAELHAHPSVKEALGTHGRYSGEMFVPAEHFDKLHLHRVIPLDAHARETYGDHGWIEEHHGTEFDTNKPIPRPGQKKSAAPLRGYQYPGPDVRDMPKEQTDQHVARWHSYMKDNRGIDMTPSSEPEDVEKSEQDLSKAAHKPSHDDLTIASPEGELPKHNEGELVAMHNLSADGLKHAHALGGLPAPSLAVSHKDHGFHKYGEISLVAGHDLVDPKKVPVFDADVYSPRHPTTRHKINRKAMDKFHAWVKPILQRTGQNSSIHTIEDDVEKEGPKTAWSRRGLREALGHEFLRQKGHEVAIPTRPIKAKYEWAREKPLMDFFDQHGYEDSPEVGSDYHVKLTEAAKQSIGQWGDQYAEHDPEMAQDLKQSHLRHWSFDKESGLLRHGMPFSDLISAHKTRNDHEVDGEPFKEAVNNKLKETGLETEFKNWAIEKMKPTTAGEYITKGGKKTPYTIDNVLSEVTKQVRQGEGFNYGLGTARAAGAVKFHDINHMKNSAHSLVSAEHFKQHKKAMDEKMIALATKLDRHHVTPGSFGNLSDFCEALSHHYKGKSIAQALTQAGFSGVPRHLAEEAKDFASEVRAMPTEYFEAKPQRVVGLHEFKGAVVPHDADEETLNILRHHGLNHIETYDPENEASRTEAVNKIAQAKKLLLSEKEFGEALAKNDPR